MDVFKSWCSYENFAKAVTGRTRYVRDTETEDFLKIVGQTAEKRSDRLSPETPLWRAQLGNGTQPYSEHGRPIRNVPCPYGPERMKPLPERATEGRANPKGIPFLYLANDRDTAIGEVRPWIGSYVSVGLFKVCRELKVVNCVTGAETRYEWIKEEPKPERREESVWISIDEAFAEPVVPTDNTADYAPTQTIAELFRSRGFHGIVYRSLLGKGHNIAIFDLDAAKLVECHLFYVTRITFDSQQIPVSHYYG